MKKNIFKKFFVLISLGFIFLGYSFVLANTDTTPPVIILNGDANVSLRVGDIFTDLGVTASDNIDGDITSSVIKGGTFIDTKTVGTYTITYDVSDQAGNKATEVVRTVNITAPVTLSNIAITTPASKLSYLVGENIDITGLVITGTYSDTSTKVESVLASNVTGFDSSVPATDQILTITDNGKTATYKVNINTAPSVLNENIIIRNGDNIIYNGTTSLPSAGTVNISDDKGVAHAVNADSILGVIYSISQTSGSAFSLSDLQYYNSMGFMLKCMVPSGHSELCSNWQYVVNGIAPWDSIDTKVLSGGETVGIYFGYPYQVTFDKTSINTGESFSATAQKYNSTLGTWDILSGVNINVTVPNPNDTWNPTIVTSQAVDTKGNAILTLQNADTYNVSISDTLGNFYYIPNYTITVNTAPSGGGGEIPSQKLFSVSKALDYLLQNPTNSSMYMDWVAIAAGAGDNSSLKSSLSSYLKSNPINSSITTDNERRAMALMSLGINPYSSTGVDYIKKITDSFDGTQIGDSSLFNDDIFALVVLSKAGYTSNDDLIKKDINYLISKQSPDGSWSGVDLTASAIQALNNYRDISGVSISINKALDYLIKLQNADGGYGNSFSTSWTLQALSIEASLYSTEIKNANDYLTLKQQDDGGVDDKSNSVDNRVWATSYSIPAVLNLSWNNILNSFAKPIIKQETTSNIIKENIENPVIVPIKNTEIKNEENIKPEAIKKDEPKITENKKIIEKAPIKNKIVKNQLPKKTTIKNSIDDSSLNKIESIPTKTNALSNISHKIKVIFTWLLVHLGF